MIGNTNLSPFFVDKKITANPILHAIHLKGVMNWLFKFYYIVV